MKIKEAEVLILQQGLTDELLQEYEKALRRSNSDYNRQQNCYMLAEKLAARDYPGAVHLVEFAMQRYRFAGSFMCHWGYQLLGDIHRCAGRPDEAKRCYQIAREALPSKQRGMENDGLLRNELTLTGYQWSEDLERFYLETAPVAGLTFSLRKHALLLAMAEYIVAEHRKDVELVAHARAWMEQLLYSESLRDMDKMWQRHRVDPFVSMTEEQQEFLRRVGVLK